MKTLASALIVCSVSMSALANVPDSPPRHPLYGKWAWTPEEKSCEEVYHFRQDNTSRVTSGEEIGDSRFTVSDQPDANGFYRMTDVVIRSNGLTGCDGRPGGTPVGDTVTLYLFFHPAKSEMVICQDPSFEACMGPLRRIPE